MLVLGLLSTAARAASTAETFLFGEGLEVADPHAVLGQRAGLVGAHDVDAGEALDGGQFVDQALASAQSHDADRERDRCHQHQTFGHHRDDCADHGQYRAAPAGVGGEQLGVDGQQPGGHQQVGDELQDPVDPVAQFGLHQGEPAGLFASSAA
jgi:hypothetical protein